MEREYGEYSIVLDPLFWQALGKSYGWGYPNSIVEGETPQ